MREGNLHVIVLAGGSGTRFWPLSRELMPKQLLSIIGKGSMLFQTLRRAMLLAPKERIWVMTTRPQEGEVRRELRSVGLDEVHMLVEPVGKNTAPAIGLAALQVLLEDPLATLAVLPSDHHIRDPQRFVRLIWEAKGIAEQGWLVTLGIKPTRPETGYGYIQRGAPITITGGESFREEVYQVARFTEKPDSERAQAYIRSGNYCWNSGMFIWQGERFMEEVNRHLPSLYEGLQKIPPLLDTTPTRINEIDKIYHRLDPISVDYGIMECADRVAVILAEMGWSDVGNWASVRECMTKDENGNVLQGDALALDTHNTFVRSEDGLVATVGVEGLVIVETADALLVCREECAQDVRNVAERLRDRGRKEARLHLEVKKPWGAYRVLDLSERYQVKSLEVKPGARLSYQSHDHRSEHWTVVQGMATVTLYDKALEVPSGEHVFIPRRARHRLQNRGDGVHRVIEVQSGDYLGEDDIVRYEDDYGRGGETCL